MTQQLQIKVIDVSVEKVDKGNGKSYEIAEVLYDVGGQKRTHKVLSFVNPGVYKTIKDAVKGDYFEVNQIKNPQGYNQWNAISKSNGAASSDTSTETTTYRSAANAPASRTFETAEERAQRQRLIVRQSSLSNAVETLSPGAKAPLDPNVVMQLAEQYTNWVFEKVDLFDEPSDIPE